MLEDGFIDPTGETPEQRPLAFIASRMGRASGAVHLRSDIERKRTFGVAEHSRLPEAAYAHPLTKQVFAALREQATLALKAGQSVVIDAVHALPDERDAIAGVAARLRVRFTGIWLDAPIDTAIERVSTRRFDDLRQARVHWWRTAKMPARTC